MSNRISARLKKIEQQTAQQSADGHKMLVELLARRDALFYPWRVWSLNSGLLHFQMQRECHAGRRGFSAKASGVVDWQSASEQRSLLIDRGLAKPMRSAGGEINALCLTPLGDATGRALVGPRLHQLGGQLPRMIYAYMCAMFDVCAPWMGGRWMAESLLWQRPLHGDPTDWEHLDDAVLPLITAGLVKADFDRPGRVYYSLRHWDKNGDLEIQPIEQPKVDVEADPKMDALYLSAYKSERAALEKLEPSHELHIGIPASCFHAFMDETDGQPKPSESDDDIRRREHFHAVLERRSYDTDLQAAISRLETFLATVGV